MPSLAQGLPDRALRASEGWMLEDRVGIEVLQNKLTLASRDGAAENPDLPFLVRAPDIAGNARVDVGLTCHERLLLVHAHVLQAAW